MSRVPFSSLPDAARLWIFSADRPLDSTEQAGLAASVETGLAAWSAHGSPVSWGYALERDQFLLVGVDEDRTRLTGCSIDSAIREIRALQTRLGVELLDNGRVFYRDGEAIRWVSRPRFREMAEAGKVTSGTHVFDNTLSTVGAYRRGRWEVPVRESWHAAAFPVNP